MNIRTRAKEKYWAAMCKAGQHDWEYIGEFVRDPIVDCSSITKTKFYRCTRCKAYAQQHYLNPFTTRKKLIK